MNNNFDQTIELHDGRRLGFGDFGSATGRPIFYFHGHPGSRCEANFLAAEALNAGIRLIGVDRPGLGLSTYQRGRSILDWTDDLTDLANSLKIDRFSVIGFSGGGPYALACAYKIPDRLISCGIISGVGHTSLFLSFLSKWLPWLILPMTRRFFRDEEQARKMLARASQKWVAPDKAALSLPGVSEILSASLVEALRQGTKGAALDGALIGSRNWGFKLENITFSNLHLWHGESDTQIPISEVQSMVKRMKTCQATYYRDEGHISLIVNHGTDVLNTMVTP